MRKALPIILFSLASGCASTSDRDVPARVYEEGARISEDSGDLEQADRLRDRARDYRQNDKDWDGIFYLLAKLFSGEG